MKAYSSTDKQKLRFSKPVTTFHDPLDVIFYPIRPSTNMDTIQPSMLFLNDVKNTKGEME